MFWILRYKKNDHAWRDHYKISDHVKHKQFFVAWLDHFSFVSFESFEVRFWGSIFEVRFWGLVLKFGFWGSVLMFGFWGSVFVVQFVGLILRFGFWLRFWASVLRFGFWGSVLRFGFWGLVLRFHIEVQFLNSYSVIIQLSFRLSFRLVTVRDC